MATDNTGHFDVHIDDIIDKAKSDQMHNLREKSFK